MRPSTNPLMNRWQAAHAAATEAERLLMRAHMAAARGLDRAPSGQDERRAHALRAASDACFAAFIEDMRTKARYLRLNDERVCSSGWH